jgi:hypothetical protein
MYIINTIQDSIYIEYSIPGAVDQYGQPVFLDPVIPPAPPDGNVIFDQAFPLDNFTIDLRGPNGTSYNTFYNEFLARIDSTGEVVTISLEDSVEVLYGLTNIIPLELKGYFGQDNISLSDTTGGLAFFDGITGGTLELTDGAVSLNIENGVGVESDITIYQLTAVNSRTGQTVTLSAPGITGTPLSIPRALNNPFIPGSTTIELTPDNSNILDVLGVLPDQLIYDLGMEINPDGNTYNYQDFFIEASRLNLFLDLEIPMEFIATNLVLEKVVQTNFNELNNREDINSGTFTLHAENGFPFNANIEMEFLDRDGNVLTSIVFGTPIEAAILNGDCKVDVPHSSAISTFIDDTKMSDILRAGNARVKTIFNTESVEGCDEAVKVYSDYALDFHLTAAFNYTLTIGN